MRFYVFHYQSRKIFKMASKIAFSFMSLMMTLFVLATKATEDDIDMDAAKNEVKRVLTNLMQIAFDDRVTGHQSLMETSGFLINDFMFEEFQKEVIKTPGRKCHTMQEIIRSYQTQFGQLLVNCCGFDYEYPKQIEHNTPMNAHLKTIVDQCGRKTLKSILSRGSSTLQQLLKTDEAPSINVDDDDFSIEDGKSLVVNTLSAIMGIVIDSRCENLRVLFETANYFVSHHTNLFAFLQVAAKNEGATMIDIIDNYRNRFFDILESAGIEEKFLKDRIPMIEELSDLREHCKEYHDDPVLDEHFEMEDRYVERIPSSGPIVQRVYSSLLRPIRKFRSFS